MPLKKHILLIFFYKHNARNFKTYSNCKTDCVKKVTMFAGILFGEFCEFSLNS